MTATTYADFLARKIRRAQQCGHRIDASATHPRLHDWQKALVQWAVRTGRAGLWADTGLGKTIMQIEWARLSADAALILAPLAVCQQTIREGRTVGVDIQYVRGATEVTGPGVWISNYEMVDRFDPATFGAVVLDECFAAGTPVDTPSGPRPIESMRVGDLICNASGVDVVADTHRREITHVVQVAYAGHVILSSPDHPYFTQRGWIAAQNLQPGDSLVTTAEAMRMVRTAVPQAQFYSAAKSKILQSILLSEMADETAGAPGESPHARGGSETRQGQECLAGIRHAARAGGNRASAELEPTERPRRAGQDLPHIEIDEPRASSTWRQRPRLDGATAAAAERAWTSMGGGVRHIAGHEGTRLPDLLQTRSGVATAESGHRGGRSLPSQPPGAGCQEGHEAGLTRVDSVEVLQRDDPRLAGLRDADGCLYLYDLGASRHPSYSVAGHLVHNCSILKQSNGKTRTKLIKHFADVPRRLACTATPAPNDPEELTNQAEFLGVMPRVEMLAAYFVHDSDGWRLKGHARGPMFRWMSTWAVALRSPADLGYPGDDYRLPGLEIVPEIVPVHIEAEGQLFATELGGVGGRAKVRRDTLDARCARTAYLVACEPDEPWLLWAGLNDEADRLAELIPGAVNVPGNWSPEDKAQAFLDFADGKIRHLITKTKIAGFGLNFQRCARMAFVGMNDSYEAYYQAIRRCYRYGQTRVVRAHIVLSELESQIAGNVHRKERDATRMTAELVAAMQSQQTIKEES